MEFMGLDQEGWEAIGMSFLQGGWDAIIMLSIRFYYYIEACKTL